MGKYPRLLESELALRPTVSPPPLLGASESQANEGRWSPSLEILVEGRPERMMGLSVGTSGETPSRQREEPL